MRIRTFLGSVGVALTLVLGACGTPPAATPPPTEPPAATAAPATAAPATEAPAPTEAAAAPTAPAADSGVTLTIWADEGQFAAVNAMADAALAEYGVTLDVQQVAFVDMLEQFQLAAPAGEGPDILVQPHNTVGELVANGLILPQDLSAVEANFAPAAIAAWQYNGQQYGLPINTENVGFFINTDIVPECPATWSEVTELSREIAADNTADVATNKYGFVRMEDDPYHFFPIMTAFGGYVFGQTAEGYNPDDVGIDSEGSLAAATWWDEYVKAGLQPVGVTGDSMMPLFENGTAAMIITGPWNVQRVIDSGIPFRICPIPGEVAEQGRPFLGSFGYVVSAFSKNPDVAQIFVQEFLGSTENMRALYELSPSVPANLEVLASVDDPFLAGFAEAGKDAPAMPAIPEMSAVWSAWNGAVLLVSQQSDDPVNAFTTAAEQIRTQIKAGQ